MESISKTAPTDFFSWKERLEDDKHHLRLNDDKIGQLLLFSVKKHDYLSRYIILWGKKMRTFNKRSVTLTPPPQDDLFDVNGQGFLLFKPCLAPERATYRILSLLTSQRKKKKASFCQVIIWWNIFMCKIKHKQTEQWGFNTCRIWMFQNGNGPRYICWNYPRCGEDISLADNLTFSKASQPEPKNIATDLRPIKEQPFSVSYQNYVEIIGISDII